ncbi:hypothetical protein F5X96DRAFT_622703 [Biscogniauxia mediterranea]|nr:hypothetical protein F5X96DRAFT_622703 [Biscogniauxia mediterranea]
MCIYVFSSGLLRPLISTATHDKIYSDTHTQGTFQSTLLKQLSFFLILKENLVNSKPGLFRSLSTLSDSTESPTSTAIMPSGGYTTDTSSMRWTCCGCGHSNNSYLYDVSCTSCFVKRCDGCSVYGV